MGQIFRQLLQGPRGCAVLCSGFGVAARDGPPRTKQMVRREEVHQKRCLDIQHVFFLTSMNYSRGGVQQGNVSNTLANYSPEMAANPHLPRTGICPPRPDPAQPSSLGPKLGLKASLTEQCKSPHAYDLSLLRLKLDILCTRAPDSHSHLAHCLISAPLDAVLVKSSDSLPDPLSLFFYPILLLLLSNFNCPGKVTVGPRGTKHQFIINVTEEGLQEALGSLI